MREGLLRSQTVTIERARGQQYECLPHEFTESRVLGDKAGYVRQRGLEPLQQEQMVLQYVEKHGRIARREAADLCRIASHQARDLLARLVRRGELEMRGVKKGSHYVRPPRDMEGSRSVTADSITSPSPPNGGGEQTRGKET